MPPTGTPDSFSEKRRLLLRGKRVFYVYFPGLIEYADAAPKFARSTTTSWPPARPTGSTISGRRWRNDPATLKRTWEDIKQIMAPGALDPLTKEMIYVAVSVTNGCQYCIASHTAAARKAGMTEAMFAELMAVVGMANESNRLANGYQIEVDEQFK